MNEGKIFVEAPAIEEVGFEKLADRLAVPNRFVDVREVTNLVRYTTYQVDNMRAVIQEDIAEGQAAAAMLAHAVRGLEAAAASLEALSGGGK